MLIGGGYQGRVDRDSNWTELDFTGLGASARTAWDLFPVMRSAQIMRCWAGFEARIPDDIPVIGPSATSEDAYHAFGFSGHDRRDQPPDRAVPHRSLFGLAGLTAISARPSARWGS